MPNTDFPQGEALTGVKQAGRKRAKNSRASTDRARSDVHSESVYRFPTQTAPGDAGRSGDCPSLKTNPYRSSRIVGRVQTFSAFARSVRRELEPQGLLETLLTDLIARSAWQVGRRVRLETGSPGRSERCLLDSLAALERLRRAINNSWGQTRPRPFGPGQRLSHRVVPATSAGSEQTLPPIPYHVEGLDWMRDEVGMESTREGAVSSGGRDGHWRDRLAFDLAVSESSPVVKGTWVTASQVVSHIVDGWSWDDIRRHYPELTEDDIRACLAFTVEQEDYVPSGAIDPPQPASHATPERSS